MYSAKSWLPRCGHRRSIYVYKLPEKHPSGHCLIFCHYCDLVGQFTTMYHLMKLLHTFSSSIPKIYKKILIMYTKNIPYPDMSKYTANVQDKRWIQNAKAGPAQSRPVRGPGLGPGRPAYLVHFGYIWIYVWYFGLYYCHWFCIFLVYCLVYSWCIFSYNIFGICKVCYEVTPHVFQSLHPCGFDMGKACPTQSAVEAMHFSLPGAIPQQ